MRRILAATAFLLLSATAAHAEENFPWIFRGKMPKTATVTGLTDVKMTPDGIAVNTTADGGIFWTDDPVPLDAEVITVTVKSAAQTEMLFVWKPGGDENVEGMHQISAIVPPSTDFTPVHFHVGTYAQWNRDTDEIGLALPAGASVVIQEMQFRRWGPMEKTIEAVKSFWTFDDFRPYAINFLWGPMIVTNSALREGLFETLPPNGFSGMSLIYGFLALAGVAGCIVAFGFTKRDLGFGIVIVAVMLSWLELDLRMGSEILSYAGDDIRTYVSENGLQKTLRTHGKLHAIIDDMLPTLREHDRFALFSPPASVVFANIRYAAYPSVPVPDGRSDAGVRLWAMLERPDIGVDEHNRLVMKKPTTDDPNAVEILSPAGNIVREYGPGTFLFETDR